jgi:hypothetical protein
MESLDGSPLSQNAFTATTNWRQNYSFCGIHETGRDDVL